MGKGRDWFASSRIKPPMSKDSVNEEQNDPMHNDYIIGHFLDKLLIGSGLAGEHDHEHPHKNDPRPQRTDRPESLFQPQPASDRTEHNADLS